jgi:hypothetical protein
MSQFAEKLGGKREAAILALLNDPQPAVRSGI